MTALKCKACGGMLQVKDETVGVLGVGTNTIVCEFCGSVNLVPPPGSPVPYGELPPEQRLFNIEVLLGLGKRQQALEQLGEFTDDYPSDPRGWLALAKLWSANFTLTQGKDALKACEYLQDALSVSARHDPGIAVRESVRESARAYGGAVLNRDSMLRGNKAQAEAKLAFASEQLSAASAKAEALQMAVNQCHSRFSMEDLSGSTKTTGRQKVAFGFFLFFSFNFLIVLMASVNTSSLQTVVPALFVLGIPAGLLGFFSIRAIVRAKKCKRAQIGYTIERQQMTMQLREVNATLPGLTANREEAYKSMQAIQLGWEERLKAMAEALTKA